MNQPKLRSGEYTVTRAADTDVERADCRTQLRRQGCKSLRFETLDDGRLVAHGYLAYLEGAEPT